VQNSTTNDDWANFDFGPKTTSTTTTNNTNSSNGGKGGSKN